MRNTIQKIRLAFIIMAIVIALVAIVYTVYTVISSRQSKAVYNDAVERFVSSNPEAGSGAQSNVGTVLNGSLGEGAESANMNGEDSSEGRTDEDADGGDSGDSQDDNVPDNAWASTVIDWSVCPLTVDFAGLKSVNPDIIGWIYCPYTAINYPVVQGNNNDIYLDHDYSGNYSKGGAIFADSGNNSSFLDGNTLVYGHHMIDGSMFSGLGKWCNQEYMNHFPYIWLLTPGGNYRIELFSAYTTSSDSDTYTIFGEAQSELMDYVEWAITNSKVKCNFVPEEDAHYIVLSTCAYEFNNARSVVHGKLVPWN